MSIFDLATETFRNIPYRKIAPTQGLQNSVFWTYKDFSGHFWISAGSEGLVKYLPESHSFQRYIFKISSGASDLSDLHFNSFKDYAFQPTNDSLLWLCGNAGVVKFNMITGAYTRYPLAQKFKASFGIKNIFWHSDNKLYVGTWAEGVFSFDPKTRQFFKCNLGRLGKSGAKGSNIYEITAKSASRLWITTASGFPKQAIVTNQIKPESGRIILQDRPLNLNYLDLAEGIPFCIREANKNTSTHPIRLSHR